MATQGGARATTRVVLIDDHEMARRGLAAMLATASWIEIVGEADACASGVEVVEATRPDVVVLDIRMPGGDGLQCLERIRALEPPISVVIVTLYDDPRYVLEAVSRGAAGYLLKDASTAAVISTLASVADGQLAIEPALLREALATAREQRPTPTPAQKAEAWSLTPREFEVLRLVADGLTNKEIGARLSITEDTVKKHVQNLIWKLHAADRTQAAIIAYRRGMLGDTE
jgi:DNA-binding NarL/FixJ family response regulator